MRRSTQVAIIGGGPSGLLLAQLLHVDGIESVVLERATKQHVLSRIRAGVLEAGLVGLMKQAGCADRLSSQGFQHKGTLISFGQEAFGIDFEALTGQTVTVYGQTELTADLYAAREGSGGEIVFEVSDVAIHDAHSSNPYLTYSKDGETCRLDAQFIAGCDGFHGVSRQSIPRAERVEYEKIYPFGWLGVLSETPPVHEELIYTNSADGFALCSMRNGNLSRYYVQCSMADPIEEWDDERFWRELKSRIPAQFARQLVTGPSIEKSKVPLRSFVTEPMSWGRLFLCGDAAHIVPPTGAKGLNTAASDVFYLHKALSQYFKNRDGQGLERYSARALARVWKTERFSWWFSSLLHRDPNHSDFDRKIQIAELEFLRTNKAAQKALAENYVGLPY